MSVDRRWLTVGMALTVFACAHPQPGDIRPEIVGQSIEVMGEGRQWDGLVALVVTAARAYRERERAPMPDPAPRPRFLLVVGTTPDQGRGEYLNGRLVNRETGVVTCGVTLLVPPQGQRAAIDRLVADLFRRPREGATPCAA
jgi:hypothetical protein